MEFWAVKKKDIYEPFGESSAIKSLKVKDGEMVKIEHWKERNVGFHRKYFALLNCTIYHLPEKSVFDRFRDLDYLRKYLLILIGKCDIIIGLSGKENFIPKSMSFKSMDDTEFQEVYNKTLGMIMKHFLKDIKQADFELDIMNFYD